MDSRFANLRQRDTSVSMLRVKLSRRRSQSQKENRERVVNTRRQLDKLQEMENSTLDASNSVSNMSTIQEKMHNKANSAKSTVLFSITSSTILTIWNIPLFLKALIVAKCHLQPFVWDRTSLILSVHDVSFHYHKPVFPIRPLFLHRQSSGREAETAWTLERAKDSREREGKEREGA